MRPYAASECDRKLLVRAALLVRCCCAADAFTAGGARGRGQGAGGGLELPPTTNARGLELPPTTNARGLELLMHEAQGCTAALLKLRMHAAALLLLY